MGDIPMIDPDGLTDAQLMARLDIAMRDCDGSSAWTNDRQRPYDGQPWTDSGLRGKPLVVGLTMRDVVDCYVLGYLYSCKDGYDRAESGKWNWNTPYEMEDTPDPMAVAQNMACEIEKMMGIFLNMPPLVDTGGA